MKKGFTFIEILIVLVILFALVPFFVINLKKAKQKILEQQKQNRTDILYLYAESAGTGAMKVPLVTTDGGTTWTTIESYDVGIGKTSQIESCPCSENRQVEDGLITVK